MDLELRETGVKMRWTMRKIEETGSKEETDEELAGSTHWVKGSEKVDFSNTRATNLKHNRRIFIPEPVKKKDFEVLWRGFERECMDTTKSVKKRLNLDHNGSKVYNLSDEQDKGVQSLVNRVSNDGLVVFQTDKSGKLTVDDIENFSAKMKPHLNDCENVDKETVVRIEDEMNARAVCWGRILNIGAKWHHEDRVKQALSSTSTDPPVIYGLPKDHKDVEGTEEHPLRPVCGANRGPGARLSNILSNLINPCNEAVAGDSQVESTEDLQACIAGFNLLPQEDRTDVVIFSMDVKALYPSIRVDTTVEAVKELLQDTTVQFENVNFTELARYLPLTIDGKDLENSGLMEVVMTRKTHLGRKPKVTGYEMTKEWDEDNSIWRPPERDPTDDEKRMMIALAVSEEVRFVMKNHLFKFRETIFRQNDGGSIGSELTGVVAKTRVIRFIRKLWQALENNGVDAKIIKAFVDDLFLAVKSVQRREDDSDHVLDDELTAQAVMQIANQIEDDIQLTFDAPSLNPDLRMPVLDMKLWVHQQRILHVFYEKSMTSNRTILKDSALAWTTKKMALAGEVARRLLNTSPELVEEGLAEEIIEEFEYKMCLSGYNQIERDIILREGRARYGNIVLQSQRGERPIYRSAEWNKKERNMSKLRSRNGWYGPQMHSVLFVQATPGEVLKKQIQEIVKKHKFKIKVVEKGGRSIGSILQRSDIEPSVSCGLPCVVCSSGGRHCSIESVGYMVKCEECEQAGVRTVMHGETGRCARVRCNEHYDALMKKKNSNLWEHCIDMHGGRMVNFKFDVTRSFVQDPLARQLDEAKRLQEEAAMSGSVLMNDKLEWVKPAGVSISVSRM